MHFPPTFWTLVNEDLNMEDFMDGNPDFMDGITDFMENVNTFSVIYGKVHWRNPKLKSLYSMPASVGSLLHYVPLLELCLVCVWSLR